MVVINQIAALAAKTLFHLQRNPVGAISQSMNPAPLSKPRASGAAKELLSRIRHITLQCATIAERFAARLVRQAELGFFPQQFLSLAPVFLRRIRLDRRHHAAMRERMAQFGLALQSWERFGRLVKRYIPPVRITHPYPEERFRVKHPRQEPCAVIPLAGICAGGRG